MPNPPNPYRPLDTDVDEQDARTSFLSHRSCPNCSLRVHWTYWLSPSPTYRCARCGRELRIHQRNHNAARITFMILFAISFGLLEQSTLSFVWQCAVSGVVASPAMLITGVRAD